MICAACSMYLVKLHSLVLLCSGAHRPKQSFLQHNMPKKRDAADAQGDWWLKETKDRLDKVAVEIDRGEDKSAPPELSWMRAGTQDLDDFRRGSPQAGGKPPLVRSGEETAELMYRASNEGLVATGYNPWRHTSYICGRPVQVFCIFGNHTTTGKTQFENQLFEFLFFTLQRQSPCTSSGSPSPPQTRF